MQDRKVRAGVLSSAFRSGPLSPTEPGKCRVEVSFPTAVGQTLGPCTEPSPPEQRATLTLRDSINTKDIWGKGVPFPVQDQQTRSGRAASCLALQWPVSRYHCS